MVTQILTIDEMISWVEEHRQQEQTQDERNIECVKSTLQQLINSNSQMEELYSTGTIEQLTSGVKGKVTITFSQEE